MHYADKKGLKYTTIIGNTDMASDIKFHSRLMYFLLDRQAPSVRVYHSCPPPISFLSPGHVQLQHG